MRSWYHVVVVVYILRKGLFEMILSQARAADAFRRAVVDRRLFLLGCVLVSIALRPSQAEQPTSSNEATLGKAVRVLAHEKSAAEQYAVILATAGKSDTALYVRGIQLYADAKAELFDYLEVFYNQRRRHSAAGRMSPAAFERKMTQAA